MPSKADYEPLSDSKRGLIERGTDDNQEISLLDVATSSVKSTTRMLIQGVFPPLTPAVGLIANSKSFANLAKGGGAIVVGAFDGFGNSLDESKRTTLYKKLFASSIQPFATPIFIFGTVKGIGEDVMDAVKEIFETIKNFPKVLEQFKEMILALLSDDSIELGYLVGKEIGKEKATDIISLIEKHDLDNFTFELGKLVGPYIVYTVLGFLGVPYLLAMSIVKRLIQILRPFLKKFPELIRMLKSSIASFKKNNPKSKKNRNSKNRDIPKRNFLEIMDSIEKIKFSNNLFEVRLKVKSLSSSSDVIEINTDVLLTKGGSNALVTDSIGKLRGLYRQLGSIFTDIFENVAKKTIPHGIGFHIGSKNVRQITYRFMTDLHEGLLTKKIKSTLTGEKFLTKDTIKNLETGKTFSKDAIWYKYAYLRVPKEARLNDVLTTINQVKNKHGIK